MRVTVLVWIPARLMNGLKSRLDRRNDLNSSYTPCTMFGLSTVPLRRMLLDTWKVTALVTL